MEISKGYKFRIYPTEIQKNKIEKTFSAYRYIYNGLLLYKKYRYDNFKEYKKINSLVKLLKLVKSTETWLNNFDKTALICATEEVSYTKKLQLKYLKNKKQKYITKNKLIQNNLIYLDEYIGAVKIILHRKIKEEFIKEKINIIKTSTGKYYISFILKEKITPLEKLKKEIKIILPKENIIKISSKIIYLPEKEIKKREKKINFLYSKLKFKQKNSKRYFKTLYSIEKSLERISNIKNNFYHELSSKIIRENQSIILEGFIIKKFLLQLKYKASWYNRNLIIN